MVFIVICAAVILGCICYIVEAILKQVCNYYVCIVINLFICICMRMVI